MNKDSQHPLILVFYLSREMMQNKDIIIPFSESINHTLAIKNANAIALFIPTDDVERVECLNPVVMDKKTNEEVQTIIGDIKKSFDIGQEVDEATDEFTDEELNY
jgi:hypothetical protein